jgi:4-carboxymuconolactone decarboxylase
MTRITVLERKDMNPEQGKLFDEVKAEGGPLGGPYWAYIRFPKLMRLAQDISSCLGQGGLSKRERQVSILAIARFWGAEYPWAAQAAAAAKIGLEREIVDTINGGGRPHLTDAREKMAYDLTRELLETKKVGDATYAAAAKMFNEKELVGLVATVGQFSMTCITTLAFDCTPTPEMANRLQK